MQHLADQTMNPSLPTFSSWTKLTFLPKRRISPSLQSESTSNSPLSQNNASAYQMLLFFINFYQTTCGFRLNCYFNLDQVMAVSRYLVQLNINLLFLSTLLQQRHASLSRKKSEQSNLEIPSRLLSLRLPAQRRRKRLMLLLKSRRS
jgi:hypothetical protein